MYVCFKERLTERERETEKRTDVGCKLFNLLVFLNKFPQVGLNVVVVQWHRIPGSSLSTFPRALIFFFPSPLLKERLGQFGPGKEEP